MPASPPDPAPEPLSCAAQEAVLKARAAERLEVLRELVELGRRLARAVVEAEEDAAAREAEAADEGDAGEGAAPSAPAPNPMRGGRDPSLRFFRISRAIRLTLAMEIRLEAGDVAALEERKSAEGLEGLRKYVIQNDICDSVQETIEIDAEERGVEVDAETMVDEVTERLTDDDWEALEDLPTAEAIAVVCDTLGVPFDPILWKRDRDTRAANRKAGVKPSPAPFKRRNPVQVLGQATVDRLAAPMPAAVGPP